MTIEEIKARLDQVLHIADADVRELVEELAAARDKLSVFPIVEGSLESAQLIIKDLESERDALNAKLNEAREELRSYRPYNPFPDTEYETLKTRMKKACTLLCAYREDHDQSLSKGICTCETCRETREFLK